MRKFIENLYASAWIYTQNKFAKMSLHCEYVETLDMTARKFSDECRVLLGKNAQLASDMAAIHGKHKALLYGLSESEYQKAMSVASSGLVVVSSGLVEALEQEIKSLRARVSINDPNSPFVQYHNIVVKMLDDHFSAKVRPDAADTLRAIVAALHLELYTNQGT